MIKQIAYCRVFGIIKEGFFKDTLVEFERGSGHCWIHASSESICGVKEEDLDTDVEHIVDYLLERENGFQKHTCGIYLPEQILRELKKRIPNTEEYNYLRGEVEWMFKNQKIKDELATVC